MKTAYCPTTHEQLGKASAGDPHGHRAGSHYHDVDVVVSRSKRTGDAYRVHVVELWGSAQGYDEEHGRREAIGRGDSVRAACEEARRRAAAAGIPCDYLETALSRAEDAAIDKETSPRPWVVKRHGSNAANQSMTRTAVLGTVEAATEDEALEEATARWSCYDGQRFEVLDTLGRITRGDLEAAERADAAAE